MHGPHVLSGGRYPVLRSLAIIYVFGAALAAISTLLTIGYLLVGTRFGLADRMIMCVGAIAAGFFLVVSMLAIAEVLKLFIDVEHNTRLSAAGGRAGAAMGEGSTGEAGSADGGRMRHLDEETAEAALLRGH